MDRMDPRDPIAVVPARGPATSHIVKDFIILWTSGLQLPVHNHSLKATVSMTGDSKRGNHHAFANVAFGTGTVD